MKLNMKIRLLALVALCLLAWGTSAALAETAGLDGVAVEAKASGYDLPIVDLSQVTSHQAVVEDRFQIAFPMTHFGFSVHTDDPMVAGLDDYWVDSGTCYMIIIPLGAGRTTVRATADDITHTLALTVVNSEDELEKRLCPLSGGAALPRLTRLESAAFSGSRLTALSLPASVTYIADDALAGSRIRTLCAPRGSYAWNWALAHGFVVEGEAPASGRLFDLKVSEEYVVQNTPSALLFTVSFEGSSVGPGIQLFDSKNASLGYMRDDGAGWDGKAGDGVYTLKLNDYVASEAGNLEFHAAAGTITSNAAVLMSFIDIGSGNRDIVVRQLNSLQSAIGQAQSAYIGSDGCVPAADVSRAVAALEPRLAALKQAGTVLKYALEADSAYIKLSTGLAYIYRPPVQNMLSASSPTSREILDIITDADMASRYADLKSAVCGLIETGMESSGVSATIRASRQSFTRDPESIQGFAPNQVLWWLGHGIKGSGMSALVTNTRTSELDASVKTIMAALRDEEWVVSGSDYVLCFTYKYIQKHCPRLDDAIVLLAACDIGSDARFAGALMEKGAKAVLTFSDWTYAEYAAFLTQNMLLHMSLINPDTHNHYTISEALSQAAYRFGWNDEEYGAAKGYDNSPAPSYPNIAGDRSARLAEAANVVFEVKNAFDRIDGARVEVQSGDVKKTVVTREPDAAGLPFDIEHLDERKQFGGLTSAQKALYYREYTNHVLIPEAKYGTYTLTVSANGYKTVEKTINVRQGSVQTVLMGAQVTGAVRRSDTQQTVSGATVKLFRGGASAGEDPLETKTSTNGQFSFDGLPYGTYTLKISKPSCQDAEYTFAVTNQSATVVLLDDILLDPDAVTGTVVDADTGRAIAGATVRIHRDGLTDTRTVATDAFGVFRAVTSAGTLYKWIAEISAEGYLGETRAFYPFGKLCDLGAIPLTPESQEPGGGIWDGTVAAAYAGGSGTQSDPYRIASGSQLALLAQQVNAGNSHKGHYFVLTEDIYLNDVSQREDRAFVTGCDLTNAVAWQGTANPWTPIGHWGTDWGSSASAAPFEGHFDGGSHAVYGADVYYAVWNYVGYGLFGCVRGGTVQNLTVADTSIGGDKAVGGVVGLLIEEGRLSNCAHNGTVTGADGVGGIVGSAQSSAQITNCRNTGYNGYVTGETVGGVVGLLMSSSSVTGCSNSGYVWGHSAPCAGLVGQMSESTVYGNVSGGVMVLDGYSTDWGIGTVVGMKYLGTTTSNSASGRVVKSSTGATISGLRQIGLYWNGSRYAVGVSN